MVRVNFVKVGLLAAYIVALGALLGAGVRQGLPPGPPNIFSGQVFIAGQPAPDGVEIFARVDGYQSNVARAGFDPEDRPIVLVKGGKYPQLVVQPPDESFISKTVTFHATLGFGDVQADETAKMLGGLQVIANFDLHFAVAPAGAPAPTPTVTPTITPTPLPTPVLPIPGDPSVPHLSRIALMAGVAAVVAGGAILFLLRRRNAL